MMHDTILGYISIICSNSASNIQCHFHVEVFLRAVFTEIVELAEGAESIGCNNKIAKMETRKDQEKWN